MQFSSYIFMFVFLPVSVLGYYAAGKTGKYKNSQYFLLLVSIWFYAYADIRYLPVLAGSILMNYLIFLLLKRYRMRKALLAGAVILNLGVLFYFKYYNFFIDNANRFFGSDFSVKTLLLPLGISFMTFQQIAFIADTYHGKTEDCSLAEYALFISFFPHIISGPIITCEEFVPMLRDENRRNINWDRLAAGIYLFAMGLGKKVLIADVLGRGVDYGYASPAELNTTSAVFISIAYTLQIYFDFSGYSDMATGISRMLNLDLPVNFNSPYQARTIVEFWDRWHITLTRFFTRYLYIPMGGSRKGEMRTWFHTMVVFLCSGFWHGASWTFVVWGFLHGLFLLLTKKAARIIERIPGWVNWCVTLLFVNAAWILFRAGSFGVFREMCKVLLANDWGALHPELCRLTRSFIWAWIPGFPDWAGALLYLFLSGIIVLKCKNAIQKAQDFDFSWHSGAFTVIILILSVLSFSNVSTYIYANF